jgi:lipid-A-disaccharide synthase-like uncharacterized protein
VSIPSSLELSALLWPTIGVLGGLIFYSRFYVQWLASEKQRRVVVPVLFWYMSGAGTLLLLPYAVASQSPLGALSQCFNIVVYTRNLVHIWRAKGMLTKRADTLIHVGTGLVAVIAIGFVIRVWLREYDISRAASATATHQTWLWLGIGLLGQVLFASRFLIQWVMTERKQESVVPPAFWHISLCAAILQTACFTQRHEWIFAVGMAATILIYIRNITLLPALSTEGRPA